MRGELVIVRDCKGKPLLRRIWQEGKSVIYITNEEHFKLLMEGLPSLEPIGFPKEDVFKYDTKIKLDTQKDEFDWRGLILWKISE